MEKEKVWDKVRQADTSKLVPGLNETELIQQLVCCPQLYSPLFLTLLTVSPRSFNISNTMATSRQPEHWPRRSWQRKRGCSWILEKLCRA
jgi:hypothetical protein